MLEPGSVYSEELEEALLDMDGAIEKARIIVLGNYEVRQHHNAQVYKYKNNEVIAAQFNPTEYSMSFTSNYKPPSNAISPQAKRVGNFQNNANNSLSISFTYDTTIQLDYLKNNQKAAGFKQNTNAYDGSMDLNQSFVQKFMGLTMLDKNSNHPPLVQFAYGSLRYTGYVASVKIKCARFNKVGEVIRAQIELTINEASNSLNKGGTLSFEKINAPKNYNEALNSNAPVAIQNAYR